MFNFLSRSITPWSSVQPLFISPFQIFRRTLHHFDSATMPKKKGRTWRSANEQRAPQLGPHMTQFKKTSDSTTKRKYYAVRHGRDGFSGVLTSWNECKLYVDGVSNAKYKSFKTLEAARTFMTSGNSKPTGRTPSQAVPIDDENNDAQTGSLTATNPPSDAPHTLTVYTDGACTRNGKVGSKAGYGVYFGEDNPYNVSEPLLDRPTNQRAEMSAMLEALQIIRQHGLVAKNGVVKVYTDSMYTKKGMDQWLPGWKKADWKTAAGTPVKNKELWVAIDNNRRALLEIGIKVSVIWVRGHVGIPGNEAADRLAVAAISMA